METRETIILDARAQHRLYVLNHVLTGGLTAEDAALVLHLSIRQVRRLLRRYRAAGSAGLVHGNRDRVPGHRIPDTIRDRVVEFATTTYAGVNHSHLAELLAEREDLDVAGRTLRRILAEANVRPVRTRRSPRHRSRRERMPREGQLLQVDGSRHELHRQIHFSAWADPKYSAIHIRGCIRLPQEDAPLVRRGRRTCRYRAHSSSSCRLRR